MLFPRYNEIFIILHYLGIAILAFERVAPPFGPPGLHLGLLGSIWASWAPFGPPGLHLGLLSFIWASWARLIAQLIARLIAHCYALYYELLHELLHAEWLGLAWLGLARLG